MWSGTEEQGNNQVNIFKDTGYLVTSTVDGYNVCIFAYGQVCSSWKSTPLDMALLVLVRKRFHIGETSSQQGQTIATNVSDRQVRSGASSALSLTRRFVGFC